MSEYWDLFDENRKPLGRTHMRGEKMPHGEFHIVVSIWTVNSDKNILITLRDNHKETYPGKWENSGGSILSGERSKQGAVRELHEETGISATEDELILLGTHKEKSAFTDIYLLHKNIDIGQLVMQDRETAAARWVSLEELKTMIDSKEFALPVGERFRHIEDKLYIILNEIY